MTGKKEAANFKQLTMRRKSVEDAIKMFAEILSNRKYRAIKDITAAAGVGATIGSAFKELGYVKMIRGAYYYTGPDVLPVAEIAAKYYEIRERHKGRSKDSTPVRPATESAQQIPDPEKFQPVRITEKESVGIAFDLYASGFNVRIFRPDSSFEIELNQ